MPEHIGAVMFADGLRVSYQVNRPAPTAAEWRLIAQAMEAKALRAEEQANGDGS
jgi:hypothetical protein